MSSHNFDVGDKCKLIKWYIGLKKLLLRKKEKHTMRKWNFDVFVPRTLVMDFESSPEVGCDHGDFSFAFSDSNFSDRVLHIYILSEPIESKQSQSVQRLVIIHVMTMDHLRAECVKTLHISSQILAARSPFFYKLFSNGMRESEQCDVNLRINASEEVAFMELLNFMYSNNLTVTTALAVLDVLMIADKFDVSSCMRHCSSLLRNLPMTPECVLRYLDLPSTVLMSKAFQTLTVAAKQFYVVHYKDMTKYKDAILSFPLAVVEAIIASDDLHVRSEDSVYCFVLKWAKAHYPNLCERRAIIATRLAKFIRYPYMTHRKLKKVLTSKKFDHIFAQKVVTEAISFKAEVPHKQHTYIRDKNSVRNRWFVERSYKYRPIKMIEFEQPHTRCVVYLDLKREVCETLFPSNAVAVKSEVFNFGGQTFSIWARCNKDSFGLSLAMWEKESGSFVFDFMIALRLKPAGEFVNKYKTTYKFTGWKLMGSRNLLTIPWTTFIGEDSVYFIDGVLHLKAELTKLSG